MLHQPKQLDFAQSLLGANAAEQIRDTVAVASAKQENVSGIAMACCFRQSGKSCHQKADLSPGHLGLHKDAGAASRSQQIQAADRQAWVHCGSVLMRSTAWTSLYLAFGTQKGCLLYCVELSLLSQALCL